MPRYQVTVVQTWHLTVEAEHEFEAENKALALDFSLECDDSEESVYAVLSDDQDDTTVSVSFTPQMVAGFKDPHSPPNLRASLKPVKE